MRKSFFALAAAAFLAGFAVGGGYTELKTRAAPAAPWREAIGTERIAVVNLDKGVEREGKRIYYAADTMEFPDANFTAVSAQEAAVGVESGYYAAALTIPVDFSEQADSLAGKPEQAVLSYRLSERLPANERAEVRRRLGNFGERMNRNIVYLYLYAILDEFHAAQDAAALSLKNHTLAEQEFESCDVGQWIQSVALPEVPEENMLSKRTAYRTEAYEALLRALEQEERLLSQILEEQERLDLAIGRLAAEEDAFASTREEAEQALSRLLADYGEREATERSRFSARLASASDAELAGSERYLLGTASASNALLLASPSDALPESERSSWRRERLRLASASDASRSAFAALRNELEELPLFPEEEIRKQLRSELGDHRQRREKRLRELREQSERLSGLLAAAAFSEAAAGERGAVRREALRAEREALEKRFRAEEREREEERRQSRAYGLAVREAVRDAERLSGEKAKEAMELLGERASLRAAENRRFFSSFAKRLPHTRNGSLPNKLSYEKMAAPLCLTEEGSKPHDELTAPQAEPDRSTVRRAQREERIPLRQAFFASIALFAGGGLGLLTGRRR